jgi:serine/threonine protein kinase/tetratricopeptide (TPR) repeat protein
MTEREMFEAALDLPSERRPAFLDGICGGDVNLRLRLESLMMKNSLAGSFLEAPLAVLTPNQDGSVCEYPGTVIGPYKLLEQIGEGGMGLVFMAEQVQPVRRRVALKILKPGMDTRQVVARFEAERQALALMDHHHIAKVFDAGVTESGRPYFVMELVRGVPITEYCDERRLSTRQRLELFVGVCQAVQHAHQKGVIHRDLKPTNVLVTQHDTVAVPKIIDFGIAKATTQPLTDRTLFTNFTQMMGTPLYMSPEQAEMSGLDVDTRTDVYALGVMLYELLTGTTPFESDTLKKIGLDEMRRMIREDEPPAPSRRLSTLSAQACSTISERRGVDGRKLGHVLRGELDWIVMKALEKDRDLRYESASALAADVQRYLNNEAVEACPPSAGYRLRKYVRRNRRGLVTVGVIAVALVTATAVSTWQAMVARNALGLTETARKEAEADRDRARNAEDQAKAAENRAETEAAVARAVSDFLQNDLLRQVNRAPEMIRFNSGANENLTVREALDRAAAKIGERFADQPIIEAAIRLAIGQSYTILNVDELATPHFKKAVELRRANLGIDNPDTLVSMQHLAANYAVTGRAREAVTLRQELLTTIEKLNGSDHYATFDALWLLAHACRQAKMFDRAIPLAKQVLDIRMATLGPKNDLTLAAMDLLARCYLDAGQFKESVAWFEKIKESQQNYSAILNAYSRALQGAGQLDEADRYLRMNLDRARKISDLREREFAVATVDSLLSLNLLLQGRFVEAEPVARESLKSIEKNWPDHWGHYSAMSLVGGALLGQHKIDEAGPYVAQGYEGMKKREAQILPGWERFFIRAGEHLICYYEATNQPEKARKVRYEVKLRESQTQKLPPDMSSKR